VHGAASLRSGRARGNLYGAVESRPRARPPLVGS
jgi:hypothetical protein